MSQIKFGTDGWHAVIAEGFLLQKSGWKRKTEQPIKRDSIIL
ncbi:MAG: hypothetical protein ACREC8_02665 [Limisphaerales bacterium]